MEINSIFHRALFRFRQKANGYIIAHPRKMYWRSLGMRVGKLTMLSKIYVTWPHQVSFGEKCILEHNSYFKFDGPYKPGPSLVFHDSIFIGSGCEFNIRVGIEVGHNCLIASGCYFVDHDHGFSSRNTLMAKQTSGAEGPITIEDDVWIGANVVVLKGVTVGRGAIIAAGSVVTKSVGPYEIWAGIPARKIRSRPE